MTKYLEKVQTKVKKFKKVEVIHILRKQNIKVDSLSEIASVPELNITKGIFF